MREARLEVCGRERALPRSVVVVRRLEVRESFIFKVFSYHEYRMNAVKETRASLGRNTSQGENMDERVAKKGLHHPPRGTLRQLKIFDQPSAISSSSPYFNSR
jgi:hypothetical protein